MTREEKASKLRQLERVRLELIPRWEKARKDFYTLDTKVGEVTSEILELKREVHGKVVIVTNDKGFGEVKKKTPRKRAPVATKKIVSKINESGLSQSDKDWLKKMLEDD